MQRADNETSGQLERFLMKQGIQLSFVPPSNHRANAAERSIRDVKNHLISTLATADPAFPLALWDELLQQVEITINLLRPASSNPDMSAYEAFHGRTYDFVAHPIVPCGTALIIHDAPQNRASWAPHGTAGFYLGPALDHHRCYRVYSVPTQSIRVTDTVAWLPSPLPLPGSSPSELLHKALEDFTGALTKLTSTPSLAPTASSRAELNQRVEAARNATTALINTVTPPPPAVTAMQYQSLEGTAQREQQQDKQANTQMESAGQQRVEVALPAAAVAAPTAPSTDSSTPQRVKQAISATHRVRKSARHKQVPERMADYQLSSTARAQSRQPTSEHMTKRQAKTYAVLNLDLQGAPLTYGNAKKGPDAASWFQAEGEEISRLIDSQTIAPIHPEDQPADRIKDTTYYNPQVKEKITGDGSKTFRVRGTAGGDRVNYPGDVSARTAEMEVIKALIHSVASDRFHKKDAQWMTLDIKDYYLGTPMPRPEFVRIPLKFIPKDIQRKYALDKYEHRGAVLFQVNKCMYGLPQAGLLSQQRLVAHLEQHGYIQHDHVDCLFHHAERGTRFSLVVDDFGVKYHGLDNANHLIDTLKKLYDIKVNWKGDKYLGFLIEFDDNEHTVTLSMPEYIPKAIQRFNNNKTFHHAPTPALYHPPEYGKKGPQTERVDSTRPLNTAEVKRLQEITGTFLFYARAVDCTMLPACVQLAAAQADPTTAALGAADRLIRYAAGVPAQRLVYKACDMILYIQSDASHQSITDSRSVAGGLFYLGNHDARTMPINGPLLAISKVIPNVAAFAGESEYAALFLNAQHGVWLRIVLDALGYPQAATSLLCDNTCAVGLANKSLKPKRSKAILMRYHWVRERVQSGEFVVTWLAGSKNIADFFTKPLPTPKHKEIQALLMAPSVVAPRVSSTAAAVEVKQQQMQRQSSNIYEVLSEEEEELDGNSVVQHMPNIVDISLNTLYDERVC